MTSNRHEKQQKAFLNSMDRKASLDGLDDFPTPPWCVRALFQRLPKDYAPTIYKETTLWDPASGRGYIANTLRELFPKNAVYEGDIHLYPERNVKHVIECDFLQSKGGADWIITNPPYKDGMAEKFVLHALKQAQVGVAMLIRLVWMQNVGRYNRLLKDNPPFSVNVFSERPTLMPGEVTKAKNGMVAYAWYIWQKGWSFDDGYPTSALNIIPPCKAELEKESDYDCYDF